MIDFLIVRTSSREERYTDISFISIYSFTFFIYMKLFIISLIFKNELSWSPDIPQDKHILFQIVSIINVYK